MHYSIIISTQAVQLKLIAHHAFLPSFFFALSLDAAEDSAADARFAFALFLGCDMLWCEYSEPKKTQSA